MTLRKNSLKSAIAIVSLTVAAAVAAQSNQPTPVVATFSILGDMVERIGGEHISVTTLVGPDGDTHVYQPTPADARAVSEAEVLIVNGLEFEGWLDRLIDASDFDGARIIATTGIKPIAFEEGEEHHDDDEHHEEEEHAENEAHGDEEHAEDGDHDHHHGAFDPHAWQSLANATTYIDNITAALAQSDPANAADFYQNRAAYVAEIEALDAEIRRIVANLPAEHRTVCYVS